MAIESSTKDEEREVRWSEVDRTRSGRAGGFAALVERFRVMGSMGTAKKGALNGSELDRSRPMVGKGDARESASFLLLASDIFFNAFAKSSIYDN